MKLKDLKQFLSLIEDDEIEVYIGIGDKITYLDILKTNGRDLVLSNKEYEQKDIYVTNINTILKLNNK